MRYASWSLLALILTSVRVAAQPTPPPDSGDARCGEYPRETVEPDQSKVDAEGFHSLFNGVDFEGWWLNCRSSHSVPDTAGPIFRVDTVRKAIYSTQRRGIGGVLMTKAKFLDYEIEFDYWPDWGNEAALQNRTDSTGRAYNTTLGYMSGTSLGGVWGESGLVARDIRPFTFKAAETDINMQGGGSSWTRLTQGLKASGDPIPCPETGCTEEDWRRLWDPDDWNRIRVRFHGGKVGDTKVHARSWFRKLDSADWIPLGADTTLQMVINRGHIGFLVHGGGRFSGPRGTWYRNIRWRPWPYLIPVPVAGAAFPAGFRPALRVDGTRQALHIVFDEAAPAGDLRILSLDGKSMAHLRGIRGEARVGTAGWKRGVYLVGVGANGRRDWMRVLLP